MVSFLLRIFSSTKQAIVAKIILALIYKEKIHRRGFIPFSNFYWVGKKITFDTIKAKSQKMVPSSLHKSLVCCMIHHDSSDSIVSQDEVNTLYFKYYKFNILSKIRAVLQIILL